MEAAEDLESEEEEEEEDAFHERVFVSEGTATGFTTIHSA